MRTIKISRKKWLANDKQEGEVYSCLWDNNLEAGCCLGHAIHQISKVSWRKLSHIAMPEGFYQKKSFLTCEVKDARGEVDIENNKFAIKAATINDSGYLTRKQKEARLIPLFKKNNLKLIFVP